jgi:Ser/Thr protein kinase RdoA (MazF antagonist)
MSSMPGHATTDELRVLAHASLASWGIRDLEPVLLKHRENAVFRIALPDGQPAVLRVHRQGYHSDAALRSELEWMAYLRDSGCPTPAPHRALNGDYLVKIGVAGRSGLWQVDCLSWVEGYPLGEAGIPLDLAPTRARQLFYSLGHMLGRLHELTARWQLPTGFERHSWDLHGFFGASPIWGSFADSPLLAPEQRDQVRQARSKALSELTAYGRDGTFGLIHADPTRENVLVCADGVRLIDFDDCGFGWHMYDVAVALYQNRRERLYPLMRESLLEGYDAVRPLTDREVRALPLFLTLRAFALIGWMSSRPETPTAKTNGAAICAAAATVAADYLREPA